MKPIFESCEPRPEVLKGDLRDDIFAARLRDVIEGRAEDVYGKPRVFFENTFPTDGFATPDRCLGAPHRETPELLPSHPARDGFRWRQDP
jgi:hypothetical protein